MFSLSDPNAIFTGSEMHYCAIRTDSTAEFADGQSPVQSALIDLARGGIHNGTVDLHIIDAPYGLGKVAWDERAWNKADVLAVMKVCLFS